MGTPVKKRHQIGPTMQRTLAGLKAIADANGVPDDGGRYIDRVGGSLSIGHQHEHPGCQEYRKVFPQEK